MICDGDGYDTSPTAKQALLRCSWSFQLRDVDIRIPERMVQYDFVESAEKNNQSKNVETKNRMRFEICIIVK